MPSSSRMPSPRQMTVSPISRSSDPFQGSMLVTTWGLRICEVDYSLFSLDFYLSESHIPNLWDGPS